MSIFDLQNREDVRRFLHATVPALAAFLVSVGVLTGSVGPLVASAVGLVFDSLLSRVNTDSAGRKWFYPLMAVAGLAALGVGHWLNDDTVVWLSVLPILLGGGVAAAKTS